MIVEVKPIPIEGTLYNGLNEQTAIRSPHWFAPIVDGRTRQYKVALSEERLEALAQHFNADLSLSVPLNDEAHPFWTSPLTTVKLEPGTNFFDTSNPVDELRLAILKCWPDVAGSWSEYVANPTDEVKWYIYSEEEELVAKESKADKKRRAFSLYEDLTVEKMIQLAITVKGVNLKGKSEKYVRSYVWEKMVEDAEFISSFIRFGEMTPEELTIHYIIAYHHATGTIVKKGMSYYYNEELLGTTLEQAVQNLMMDDYQPLKLHLLEQIK